MRGSILVMPENPTQKENDLPAPDLDFPPVPDLDLPPPPAPPIAPGVSDVPDLPEDLSEMMKIIGYHIPKSAGSHRQFISEKFGLGPEYGNNEHAMKYPVTYQYRIHTRVNSYEDDVKQKAFRNMYKREDYLVIIYLYIF